MARPVKRGLDYFPFDVDTFEDEAPVFGFNSLPSQTQFPGNSILFAIIISFDYLEARLRFSES